MPKKIFDLKICGSVIRILRKNRGLSQETLADLASLHRTYIGGIERGERNLSIMTLSRILETLQINWRDFGDAIDDFLKEDME